MHTYSLIMLASWPLIIISGWYLIRWALKKYEQKEQKHEQINKSTDQQINK